MYSVVISYNLKIKYMVLSSSESNARTVKFIFATRNAIIYMSDACYF